MKRFKTTIIPILLGAVMLGAASCSDSATDAPQPAPQFTTIPADLRIEFNEYDQDAVSLDIDDNGSVDYVFFAREIESAIWGKLAMVGILAGREGNEVMARSTEQDQLCQVSLPMSPGQTLKSSETFGATSVWATDALLYGSSDANGGCQQYRKYIDYSVERYIGVRFLRNGAPVYGYIKLTAADTVDGTYPDCADVWKISEFGYMSDGEGQESAYSLPA